MESFSSNSISAALGLFNVAKKAVKTVLLSMPLVAYSHTHIDAPSYTVETSLQAIKPTEQKLSEQEIAVLVDGLTKELEKVFPILDCVVYLMPEVISRLNEQDIENFGSDLSTLDKLTQEIKNNAVTSLNAARCQSFLASINVFSEKVHLIYQSMLSGQYKLAADTVLLSRVHQDELSVGYRFNPDHSFEDFKKMIS